MPSSKAPAALAAADLATSRDPEQAATSPILLPGYAAGFPKNQASPLTPSLAREALAADGFHERTGDPGTTSSGASTTLAAQ